MKDGRESPIRDLADEILDVSAAKHPALLARAAIASVGSVPVTRTHLSPNYGSDLGLRKSDDPQVFLFAAAGEINVDAKSRIRSWDASQFLRAWESESMTEAQAAGHLDMLISFAGMWDEAATCADSLSVSKRVPSAARLLTYMGAALSSAGSTTAGQLFISAAHARDALPAVHWMSEIRLCAWYAKRRNDPERAANLLQKLRANLALEVKNSVISPGDGAVLSGVSLNLEALTAVKRKDPSTAHRLLQEASELLQQAPLVMVGEDERRRYFVQVQVNIGQLHAQLGEYAQALEQLRRNLEWTRANHPESLSEAISLTGYLEYLNKRWPRAIELLSEAERLIAAEGAPSRLALVRKNLAAALFQNGEHEAAETMLTAVSTDVTGLSTLKQEPQLAA